MALPLPEPGLVIRFNYLWKREQDQGRENARYPRPCAIVLSHRRAADGGTVVLVVPITHSAPTPDTLALELPPRVKQHLGLDDALSWVVVDEVNEFAWPGFDLAPNSQGEVAYGLLPPKFYERVRVRVLESAQAGRLDRVPR
jgi:mRNA-degrading endonuclease toxin of MazEF toxin-antitoxin module